MYRTFSVAAVALATAAMLLTAPPAHAKPKRVVVTATEYAFTPQNIVVSVGDTVEWKNAGATIHTATSGYGSNDPTAGTLFDSGVMSAGASYRHVFTAAGKIPYFCLPHEFFGMKGAVSVVNPAPKRVDVQVNDNLNTQAFFFSPAAVTVAPGDTIKWTNVGHTVHTVTSGTYGGSDEGVLFDSGAMNIGQVFRWVVADTAGTLAYHCVPHADLGMVGSITLKATAIGDPVGPVVIEPQAFPNPSRGAVALGFSLPGSGPITVEVLDAAGRVVSELFRGVAEAGGQRLMWSGRRSNGQRVQSGHYYFRITSVRGVSTGHLTLIR